MVAFTLKIRSNSSLFAIVAKAAEADSVVLSPWEAYRLIVPLAALVVMFCKLKSSGDSLSNAKK